jgi:hypothetical protein
MRPAVGRGFLALAFAVSVAAAAPARAQSFGQNKVHYESPSWSVLETPHLRLHFYAEEESLARELTVFAESVCVEFDGRFHVHPRTKVPLLLYSTHQRFQQTNATPELLTESIGGLTELIKGRVLIPHTGSWARLRWVTRHELTHAYQLEKLSQVMHAHHRPPAWYPPLWFTEGLAEFCGTTWDEDAEGLLRDMFTSRMAYPMTHSDPITGSVEMYKEGQAFLLWVRDRYGEERIFDLLENAWRAEDFESDFKMTFGRPLEDVDEEWFHAMQQRYYPVVALANRPREVARPLPQPSRFNLGPRALPAVADSDTTLRVCWFAVDDGSVDLVTSVPRPRGGRRTRRLLRSGNTPAFESVHLFQNRPDVSPSGLVAVAAQKNGHDALYLLDARDGRVRRRLEFPELVALHDPSLAPGDSSAVFVAQDGDGRSDLYRASWGAKGSGWRGRDVRLERLMHDDYDDEDPAVSPDGKWVAFASDRGDNGGRYALFRLSLASGGIERLSWPEHGDDRQPDYSPDGRWLAFRSTRGGTSDLYVRRAEPTHEVARLTNLVGPASDPDWTRDGRGLLFTAQDAVTFRTWCLRFDPDTLAEHEEVEPAHAPVLPVAADLEPAQDYQKRLGLDLIQNAIGLSPSFNSTMGFGQIAVSDILGNEQWLLTLANDSDRFGGDFWSGWEGGLTYFNQAKRLNYGIGVFRLTSLYDPDFEVLRREVRYGVLGLASYPLNRFDRIDASLEVRHAAHHLLRSGADPTVDLVSNYVSLVRDNSRWSWDGPVGGFRMNLTAGYTRDMSAGLSDYGTLLAEVRHYRQPLPRVVLAMRATAQGSFGADAQNLYFGGPTRLHIPTYNFMYGQRVVGGNLEARFPLVRGLTIAVPSPWQLPTVNAAVYGDGARTWTSFGSQELGVLGYAIYVGGGFAPALRWNWSWTSADFVHFDSRVPLHYFSIAYNF